MEYCVIMLLSTIVTRMRDLYSLAWLCTVCLYQCNGNWYLTEYSAIRTTLHTNIPYINIQKESYQLPELEKWKGC